MPTSKRRRTAVQSADTLRIRDFRLLVALHEAGNLTAAAEQVGISQPAATKQVKAIHRRLKVRLYDSEAGDDKLTPAAHALLPAAVDIVQVFHRGMYEVHEALLGGEHLLRVGASSYLHERWHRLLDSVELRLHRNVTDDEMLARLTPAGAEHIARPGIVARPLDDPEIRLETHIAVFASNTSPLVAEYYKGFLQRVEEEHSPIQLTLPMPIPVQSPTEHQLSLRWSA